MDLRRVLAVGSGVASAFVWLACVGSDPPFDASKEADGATNDSASANDSSSTNDSSPTPPSDGGTSGAPGNLLKNADFATNCDPWFATNALAPQYQADGNKTPGACHVCGDGVDNGWVLEQDKMFDTLDPTTTFLTGISMRTLDGADAGGATIDLEVWDNTGSQIYSEASGELPSGTSWTPLTHPFTASLKDGSAPWTVKFQLNCRSDSCRTACLIVDDARLEISK